MCDGVQDESPVAVGGSGGRKRGRSNSVQRASTPANCATDARGDGEVPLGLLLCVCLRLWVLVPTLWSDAMVDMTCMHIISCCQHGSSHHQRDFLICRWALESCRAAAQLLRWRRSLCSQLAPRAGQRLFRCWMPRCVAAAMGLTPSAASSRRGPVAAAVTC